MTDANIQAILAAISELKVAQAAQFAELRTKLDASLLSVADHEKRIRIIETAVNESRGAGTILLWLGSAAISISSAILVKVLGG